MADLNLDNSTKELTPKERYDFLIKAKNFHYDNYNKWLTYFYVAIGALFVGYYTLTTSNTDNKFKDELLILVSLGYIVSLLWYWSSKGYYFWNINFITLVNDCEETGLKLAPKDRVYFTFANKKTQNNYLNPIGGANISTSKIAIFFSFLIAVIWGTLLLNNIFSFCLLWKLIASIGLTLFVSWTIPQIFFKSKITHFPDLGIDQKVKKLK